MYFLTKFYVHFVNNYLFRIGSASSPFILFFIYLSLDINLLDFFHKNFSLNSLSIQILGCLKKIFLNLFKENYLRYSHSWLADFCL